MSNDLAFSALQEKIEITFRDPELLKLAFVHRSYVNEAKNETPRHNERLEFLGDAVLELVVTEHLYKEFPSEPEGVLTNWRSAIVRGEILSQVSRELGLGELLFLSRGEQTSGGRERGLILANTFEALIGAIYLDRGYEVAAGFINRYLIPLLPNIIEQKLYIDAKSRLQELSQEKAGKTPSYKVLAEDGPDHSKEFRVGVFVGADKLAEGRGASKQRAEQAAAAEALKNYSE